MSPTALSNPAASPFVAAPGSTRIERPAPQADGLGATLTGLAADAAAGVSATVSFSGKALQALEQAGESVVDGVEDVAIGAWHAVQRAAVGAEHVGQAIGDGAHEIATTVATVGKELGHYAAVGLSATGEAASEVASGAVMAASAVGKGISALI